MIGRYAVWMNGVNLETLDDDLLLTGLAENEPSMSVGTINKLGGGTARLNAVRRSLSVKIGFNILSYDLERRKELCRRVYQWAREGWLEISDRPGQRLKAVCDAPPAMDTSTGATDQYSLTLTAYELPWWESTTTTIVSTGSGKEVSASISVPGDEPTLLSAKVTAAGALTTLTIRTENGFISLSGLSVAAGEEISIDYTGSGYLLAKVGETSVYSKLTVASDDVLTIPAGTSTVTLKSDAEVSAILQARGRFD